MKFSVNDITVNRFSCTYGFITNKNNDYYDYNWISNFGSHFHFNTPYLILDEDVLCDLVTDIFQPGD